MDVEWRSSKLQLDESWKHLLSTGLFSDIKITVKDKGREKTFTGHKVLLMMVSPAFEAMLSGNFTEKNEIIIEDVCPDAFQIFFNYLYLQTVVIPDISLAWGVYQITSKYIVEPVWKYCIEYINDNCNVKTWSINYDWAEYFGLEDIKMRNYEFILSNLSTYFAEPEFLSLSKAVIVSILDEPVLLLKESDLFINLEKWIQAQINREEVTEERERLHKVLIEELVCKIRFLEMTPEEFADSGGRSQSQTLSQPQKLSIFMNISGSKKEHPLESGIQRFNKMRLRNGSCNCRHYNNSCSFRDLDLHYIKFKGQSYLSLFNVDLGVSGTTMSFRFRLSSNIDTILFCANCENKTFKIYISDKKLSVSFSTNKQFKNLVADGRTHTISISFTMLNTFNSRNMCRVIIDGVAETYPDIECGTSYFKDLKFGSYENKSEADFCLGSVIVGNNSECLDLKNYHHETRGISLCRCMSS